MIDILEWMQENIPAIVGYIGTAASATLAIISCWRAHKIKITCDKILADAFRLTDKTDILIVSVYYLSIAGRMSLL